jgi:hypothetical protein
MPVDLGTQTFVTLVADADTPAGLVQYNGWKVGVPAGKTLPTGVDVIQVNGQNIPGYGRTGASGPEWVMAKAVNPEIAALDALPGPGGWTDQTARAQVRGAGQHLLELGVPRADMRAAVKAVFDASRADFVAAHP